MNSYGGYYGGDPRKFHPDEEVCSEAEIAAHKAACEAWNRGERPEPQGHESHYDKDGKLTLHIARNPYGLGVTEDDEDDDQPWDDEPTLPLEGLDDEALMEVYLSNAGHDSEMAARILADRHGVDLVASDDNNAT